MNQQYKVLVRKKGGGFSMYHIDEEGKEVSKQCKSKVRSLADREAETWENRLNNGESDSKVSWEAFRTMFEDQYLIQVAPTTKSAYNTCLNRFEQYCGKPLDLRKITNKTLTKMATDMLAAENTIATVRMVFRHIKAALGWAKAVLHVIRDVPRPILSRSKKGLVKKKKAMKGRPITRDEFKKFLEAAKLERPNDWQKWHFVLKGLWNSSLRISEAVQLDWEVGPVLLDMDGGEFPRIHFFEGDGQKSGEDEFWTLPPLFAKQLSRIPPEQRKGKVFGLTTRAIRIISAIGKRSGVVVNSAGKHASAHDFRRSFGTRWAPWVDVHVLKAMMRHSSINTTLDYYVEIDADKIGRVVYDAYRKMRKTPEKLPKARKDQKPPRKKSA